MADTQTRADSLRLYLTGAGSDDGSQIDDNASLGGYRSSTEVVSLAASRASAIANITIDFVAGKNGIGAGTLTVTGDDTLTWTPHRAGPSGQPSRSSMASPSSSKALTFPSGCR